MAVERLRAHPEVRQDAGRIALKRGPLVYCLEEVDNAANLNRVGCRDERSSKAGSSPSCSMAW